MAELKFWHDRRLWTVDGRLTEAEAKSFLKGRAPRLKFPMKGPKPDPTMWRVGEEVVIEAHRLSFLVTNLKGNKGFWEVVYTIKEARPRYLARRSGYTADARKALGATERHMPGTLREEPENVDERGIGRTRSDMVNRQRVTAELPKERLRREERRQLNRLRDTKRKSLAKGLDISGLDAAIERELLKLQEQLDQAA